MLEMLETSRKSNLLYYTYSFIASTKIILPCLYDCRFNVSFKAKCGNDGLKYRRGSTRAWGSSNTSVN